MIGRPFRVNWRQEDTPEALKAAYRAERDTMLRTRLHGLWLLRCGRRLGEVASVVGIHYRTVQTWVSWYRKGGVEEVLSHRMKGKGQPGFLSEEQERELAEEVESGRFRTAGDDQGVDRVGVWSELPVGKVYSLLERLAMLAESAAWSSREGGRRSSGVLEKGGLGEALAGAGVTTETVLGFADEMRVGLRGMVRRVWGRRGVKVRQRVQLVYEWRYLFCVVVRT